MAFSYKVKTASGHTVSFNHERELDEDIQRRLAEELLVDDQAEKAAAAAADKQDREDKTGFIAGVKSGFVGGIGDTIEGAGYLAGADAIEQKGKDIGKAGEEMYRGPQWGDVKEGWSDDQVGIGEAAGNTWDFMKGSTGQLAGYLGPMLIPGTLAAKAVGGIGKAAQLTGKGLQAAKSAGFLAGTEPMRVGEMHGQFDDFRNAEIAAGRAAPEEGSKLSFAGYGLAHGALDVVALGALSKAFPVLGKVLGAKQGSKLSDAQLKALAERSYVKRIGVGTAQFTATELPIEIAQEVLNRSAAGQDLNSEEAWETYEATAAAIVAAGPAFGGIGGISSGPSAQNELDRRHSYRANQRQNAPRAPAGTLPPPAPNGLPPGPMPFPQMPGGGLGGGTGNAGPSSSIYPSSTVPPAGTGAVGIPNVQPGVAPPTAAATSTGTGYDATPKADAKQAALADVAAQVTRGDITPAEGDVKIAEIAKNWANTTGANRTPHHENLKNWLDNNPLPVAPLPSVANETTAAAKVRHGVNQEVQKAQKAEAAPLLQAMAQAKTQFGKDSEEYKAATRAWRALTDPRKHAWKLHYADPANRGRAGSKSDKFFQRDVKAAEKKVAEGKATPNDIEFLEEVKKFETAKPTAAPTAPTAPTAAAKPTAAVTPTPTDNSWTPEMDAEFEALVKKGVDVGFAPGSEDSARLSALMDLKNGVTQPAAPTTPAPKAEPKAELTQVEKKNKVLKDAISGGIPTDQFEVGERVSARSKGKPKRMLTVTGHTADGKYVEVIDDEGNEFIAKTEQLFDEPVDAEKSAAALARVKANKEPKGENVETQQKAKQTKEKTPSKKGGTQAEPAAPIKPQISEAERRATNASISTAETKLKEDKRQLKATESLLNKQQAAIDSGKRTKPLTKKTVETRDTLRKTIPELEHKLNQLKQARTDRNKAAGTTARNTEAPALVEEAKTAPSKPVETPKTVKKPTTAQKREQRPISKAMDEHMSRIEDIAKTLGKYIKERAAERATEAGRNRRLLATGKALRASENAAWETAAAEIAAGAKEKIAALRQRLRDFAKNREPSDYRHLLRLEQAEGLNTEQNAARNRHEAQLADLEVLMNDMQVAEIELLYAKYGDRLLKENGTMAVEMAANGKLQIKSQAGTAVARVIQRMRGAELKVIEPTLSEEAYVDYQAQMLKDIQADIKAVVDAEKEARAHNRYFVATGENLGDLDSKQIQKGVTGATVAEKPINKKTGKPIADKDYVNWRTGEHFGGTTETTDKNSRVLAGFQAVEALDNTSEEKTPNAQQRRIADREMEVATDLARGEDLRAERREKKKQEELRTAIDPETGFTTDAEGVTHATDGKSDYEIVPFLGKTGKPWWNIYENGIPITVTGNEQKTFGSLAKAQTQLVSEVNTRIKHVEDEVTANNREVKARAVQTQGKVQARTPDPSEEWGDVTVTDDKGKKKVFTAAEYKAWSNEKRAKDKARKKLSDEQKVELATKKVEMMLADRSQADIEAQLAKMIAEFTEQEAAAKPEGVTTSETLDVTEEELTAADKNNENVHVEDGSTGNVHTAAVATEDESTIDYSESDVYERDIDPDADIPLADLSSDSLYRMHSAPSAGFESAADLIDYLKKHYNAAAIDAAIKSGRLKIHENEESVSKGKQNDLFVEFQENGRVSAGWVEAGKNGPVVHLVAANLDSGSALRTLIHEAGVHAGWEGVLGKQSFDAARKQVADTIKRLRNKEATTPFEKAVLQAFRKARKAGTPAAHMTEEALAYLIDANANLPLVRRLLAGLKQWLRKMGLWPNTEPSVNELTAMAHRASKNWLLGNTAFVERTLDDRTYYSKQGPTPTAAAAATMDYYTDEMGREFPASTPIGFAQFWSRAKASLPNKLSKEERESKAIKFGDRFLTSTVDKNYGVTRAIRDKMRAMGASTDAIIGTLLAISDSQQLHASAMGGVIMSFGKVVFNKDIQKWEGVKDEHNFQALTDILKRVAEEKGYDLNRLRQMANDVFIARRFQELRKTQEQLEDKAEQAYDRDDRKNGDKFMEEAKRIHVNWSEEEVAQAMRLVEMEPSFNEMFDMWDGIRKNFLDTMAEGGVLSRAAADKLFTTAGYVPFYRELQDRGKQTSEFDPNQALLRHARKLEANGEFKHLGKSELDITDIFGNMERVINLGVEAAISNHKGAALIDTMVGLDMAEKITGELNIKAIPGRQRVTVYKNGEALSYKVNEPLWVAAFKGMEGNVGGPLMTYGIKMSNFLRKSIVLSPLFSLAQISMDSFAAITSSGLPPRQAIKLLKEIPKEFYHTTKALKRLRTGKGNAQHTAAHEALYRRGAVGWRDWSAAAIRADVELKSHLKENGMTKKAMNALEDISMASDNAVRQAIYNLTLAEGKSEKEAIERGFEIINFRRKGSHPGLAALAHVVPFLNAAIQGQYVAFKTMSGEGISPRGKRSRKVYAQNTAMISAMTAAYTMIMSDDDEYNQIDPVMRDRMLHLGGGFGVPLRMDYTMLPKVLTEHMVNLLMGNAFEDKARFAKSLSTAVINAIALPVPIPQGGKSVFEATINHSFFTGRDVVSRGYADRPAEDQFTAATSEFSKSLGNLGISPIKADHIINGLGGTLGGLFLMATSAAMSGAKGVERPENSWRDFVASVPGMSRFIQKEHGGGLRSQYYEMNRLVDEVVAGVSAKHGNADSLQKYLNKGNNTQLYRQKGISGASKQQLAYVRRMRRNVANHTEWSSAQKKKELKRINDIERSYMRGNHENIMKQREAISIWDAIKMG